MTSKYISAVLIIALSLALCLAAEAQRPSDTIGPPQPRGNRRHNCRSSGGSGSPRDWWLFTTRRNGPSLAVLPRRGAE